jgi:L-lactate dehydrogenase (cytochrome)
VILKYAGQDATEAFEPIHPGDTLEKYLLPQYVKFFLSEDMYE